jgi:DNA-binding NarL/FixJ family response regulator
MPTLTTSMEIDDAPPLKLIYLMMDEDPEIARRAMREYASGYLLRSSAAQNYFLLFRWHLNEVHT